MESIKIIINKIRDGSIKQMWIEFKWMFSYAKKYKKEIAFYIFLGMFSTVMSLVSSIASKELIDVVTGHNISGAPMIATVMISMALFSLFFNSLMSRITLKINIRIQNDIQADIFDKIYVSMLTISFRTGLLDETMQKISEKYEEAVDKQISRFISVLEPTLVIILSVFVGLILISFLLPLIGIMSSIG